MPHDIIDNRDVTLVAKMRDLLPSTAMARFAVGYFFLSGLEAVADTLDSVKELRLLIGNTTNRRTLEQIAEGYRRLDEIQHEAEALRYPKRVDLPRMASETATAIGETTALMDQTDEAEYLVTCLADLIAEGRLHVRVYTKGRLHAKAYICSYGQSYDAQGQPLPKTAQGVGIVGSSNLSLAGITSNTELNVMVHGDGNHAALVGWFDELWDEAEPFDEHLVEVLKTAWPLAEVTPYEIYLKTLWELVRDRIEAADLGTPLWHEEITTDLAEFQRDAVNQAIAMINTYDGCFVSDVVGLGKTYVGAAILRHYVLAERAQPLIICPSPLVPMWESFAARYDLNARVLSMGMLREREDEGGDQWLRDDPVYRHCNLVLVDESHNFRNSDSQRYRVLQTYLGVNDRRAVFLTATPRNTSAWDLYHQIKLFHQEDITTLPVDPPDLRRFVQLVESSERRLPDLLTNLLIRRCRRDVLRQYGYDAETDKRVDPEQWAAYRTGQRKAYVMVADRKQFFPERQLDTVHYSIEETYSGLHERIRRLISPPETLGLFPERCLTYARYGLGNYVLPQHQRQQRYQDLRRAGFVLRGLMRIMLFKRFESSVQAFRLTVGRMLETHRAFLEALSRGIVSAGDDAKKILDAASQMDERELYDALTEVCGRYEAHHFDLERLTGDLAHDIEILEELLGLVEPITPEEDDKLLALRAHLQQEELRYGKRLIFTQFADTAQYLYENLGDLDDRLDVIYSGDRDPTVTAARFSPKANQDLAKTNPGPEIDLLVATDVLSEGLNLQDCDRIINYDLHWNPVRLIQRFGRIDRIGSEHERVYAWNFLPETALEENLGLHESLRRRIQEIHDTIGEDAAILDPSEQVNEEAMYAIYAGEGVDRFEDEDVRDPLVDLGQAEESIRRLRETDPALYERITTLADGVRCGRSIGQRETYVFCRAGRYRRLYLIDEGGEIITTETPRVLRWLRCDPNTPAATLPHDHNDRVMAAKATFDAEVAQRQAQQRHATRHTRAQSTVLRELRTFRGETEDRRQQAQVDRLLEAFGRHIARQAVRRELNRIVRDGVVGAALVTELARVHGLYRMDLDDDSSVQEEMAGREAIPRIMCSEAGLAK
jgi:hypothetical protein